MSAETNQQCCLPVVGADTQVPLISGKYVKYANLDCAASAPALLTVAERVNQVLPLYASVHRGAGYLSQVSTALYEAARKTIGDFVNARETDSVIITRNSTDSLNLLAGCVPADGNGEAGKVLVLDVEHHANFLSWQRHNPTTVLTGAATIAETIAEIASELAENSYQLLAITGASNVTGEALPISDVVALAHSHGARVVLDGAQVLPHRPFDIQESGVDFLVFSGH